MHSTILFIWSVSQCVSVIIDLDIFSWGVSCDGKLTSYLPHHSPVPAPVSDQVWQCHSNQAVVDMLHNKPVIFHCELLLPLDGNFSLVFETTFPKMLMDKIFRPPCMSYSLVGICTEEAEDFEQEQEKVGSPLLEILLYCCYCYCLFCQIFFLIVDKI